MKKFCFVLSLLMVFISSNVFSQDNDLFIPKNILKAYKNGTRSYDGKPGPNYWQNHSDYKINAELIPGTNTISGEEWITYYNDSPDSLNQMVFRLYQNIMKKGSPRDFPVNPEDLTDGVKLDTLVIDGKAIDYTKKERGWLRSVTNLIVSDLAKKIAPKSSVKIYAKCTDVLA